MKCSTIVRGKAKFAEVTENQPAGLFATTFQPPPL